MKKEAKREMKQLNTSNTLLISKMYGYLQMHNLKHSVLEEINLELIGMCVEGQMRGLEPEAIFGEDIELFCDQLIENGVKQHKISRFIFWIVLVSTITTILLLGMWLQGILNMNGYKLIDQVLTIPIQGSINITLLICFGVIISLIANNHIFNKSIKIFVVVSYILFSLCASTISILAADLFSITTFTLPIYVFFSISLCVLIISSLVYYRQKKK